MCIWRVYDLDQSMGRMLPKLPVMVHHILNEREIARERKRIIINHMLNLFWAIMD